ncbi:biotin transporter BioY [Dictyobacter kobayashii]|uniref:Biotin transporter n=1 Tax=Dictyobacter kobayashii TaxID=2014872 RepID=A0A402AJ10_9CHLR|nr:biotin transporter BioY [Dictyobacter kobayashii]GCE19045.1 biotin biosynthesis protein BioY [Dictyobacter kobayashii]
MAIAPRTTLIDYVSPAAPSRSTALLKDGALVVGTSLLMTLAAKASFHVPFSPIPFTLQTLVVMLAAATLGSRRGALAMLLYLIEGASGLPVFASGGGFLYLILSPSAGYLWSYPLAAFAVGYLCERGLDRKFSTSILAMLPGTCIIYALGVSWLAVVAHLNLQQAIVAGMLPYIPFDLAKMVIAAILMPVAWLLVNRQKSDTQL